MTSKPLIPTWVGWALLRTLGSSLAIIAAGFLFGHRWVVLAGALGLAFTALILLVVTVLDAAPARSGGTR